MAQMGTGQAGHEKYNIEYVLSRAPTYVVLGTYRLTAEPLPPERQITPFYPAELGLLASPEFHRRYRYQSAQTHAGWFGYFERAD